MLPIQRTWNKNCTTFWYLKKGWRVAKIKDVPLEIKMEAYFWLTMHGRYRKDSFNCMANSIIEQIVLYLRPGRRASMEDTPRQIGLQLATPFQMFQGWSSDQLRSNELRVSNNDNL